MTVPRLALIFVFCTVLPAGAASRVADLGNPWFETMKNEMTIQKAVEDIDRNFPLIVSLGNSFGESWYLTWGWPIADRLPSQPVAVIKVFAATRAKDHLSMVCPRFPSDNPPDAPSELSYLQRASEALSSFILVDAAEESVRKECLANVEESIRLMQKEHPGLRPSQPWPVKEN